jgi:hypothetical protein
MKSKLLDDFYGRKTWVLALDAGDEVVAELTAFATANKIIAASLTGIGGFSEVTLGYFNLERKDYDPVPVPEQVELMSLAGNIAITEGKPRLHAHVVVGKRDGTAHGGHLLEARVLPTVEIVLIEAPRLLERALDPRFNLPLLKL